MNSEALKKMEEKYGHQAKVKPGKAYADMHRAKPSSSMGIVVVFKDGKWKQLNSALVHEVESYDNVEEIWFMYMGATYLTINVHKPAAVIKAIGSIPNGKGIEREETKQVHRHKRMMPKTIAEEWRDNSSTTEDVDVPW